RWTGPTLTCSVFESDRAARAGARPDFERADGGCRPSTAVYVAVRLSGLLGPGGPVAIAVNAEIRNPRLTLFAGVLWPAGHSFASPHRSTAVTAAQSVHPRAHGENAGVHESESSPRA